MIKYDRHNRRRDHVLRNWKTAVVTGKANTHDDEEEEEPTGPRFTSVQRHLTSSWKIVRPTVLINGFLTVWRIVAGKGETTRWRILSQNREILRIFSTKNRITFFYKSLTILLQFYIDSTNLCGKSLSLPLSLFLQYYSYNKQINIQKRDRSCKKYTIKAEYWNFA